MRNAKLFSVQEQRVKPNQNYVADQSVAPVVRVYKLGEESKDTSYWLTRPPEERNAMIERLRREFFGSEYDFQQDPETLFKVTVRKLR
jgi:hypothetical protein